MKENSSISEEYLFFWGHQPSRDGTITKNCLSQWYECCFENDGITYHTAEQYMMAEKARLFGDESALSKIMSAHTPREYKSIGRSVKNFSYSIWQAKRFEIVVNGNYQKFSQNEPLKKFLLETNDKLLVEASLYDRIWGVGMSIDDPKIIDPHNWRGENLLGLALMLVRDLLRKGL